jgi:hypothetical protein
LAGKRSHQFAGIKLITKPAGIITRRENDRHTVMDVDYQLARLQLSGFSLPIGSSRGNLLHAVIPVGTIRDRRQIMSCATSLGGTVNLSNCE